jgi:carboxyl-terminal processing protease
VVPSVEHEILEGNIAYVRLYNFGDNSDQDLRDALEEVLSQNPDGLILDLRNNGGGWLDTAVNVASEFLNGGVVLYEEYGDGTRDTFDVREDGVATAIPLVVLVNDGTASASEIVAGAIQDYERGTLVGVTTYGKGSVQLPIVLENEQGALRVTIARWLTPDERLIHDVGLTPDVVVELTEEDFEAGRDPQLDAAIAILLDEIS